MGWFQGKSTAASTESSQNMTMPAPATQRTSYKLSNPNNNKITKESSSQKVTSSSATKPKGSNTNTNTYEPPSTSAQTSAKVTKANNTPAAAPSKSAEDESAFDDRRQIKPGDTGSQSVPENPKSYSYEQSAYAEDSDHQQQSISQNHLNSLFNGHLMKWKFEAEEGTIFLRLPAFLGALGQIGVAITAFVLNRPASVEAHSIVMYTCIILMSLLVLILDGRFLSSHPLSIRSHLRNIATRNFNILRFLWGRGLLYTTIGVLTIGQMWLPTIAAGSYMCFVGLLAIVVGVHASRKFAALRNSLADESFLLLVFANYDSDADGYIEPREFAWLLVDLGVELDDRYTLKAFNSIDKDGDRLISFEEFSHWWSSGFVERGRKMYGDDEDSYRRMDERV